MPKMNKNCKIKYFKQADFKMITIKQKKLNPHLSEASIKSYANYKSLMFAFQNQNKTKTFKLSKKLNSMSQIQKSKKAKVKILTIKTILNMQLLKHKDNISEFVFKLASLNSKSQTLMQYQLSQLLNKYLLNESNTDDLSESIFRILYQMVKQRCRDTFSQLTQRNKKEYELISAFYLQRYRESKLAGFAFTECTQYLSDQPFTPQRAFLLDILSHFFKSNREYREYYGDNMYQSVFTPIFISNLFKVPIHDIARFQERFNQMAHWISFEFEDIFQHLIKLMSLVELKHRTLAFRAKKQIQNPKNIAVFYEARDNSLNSLKGVDQTRIQNHFKYKFCEIAFLKKAKEGKSSKVKEMQISQHLKKLLSLQSIDQRKNYFIEAKVKFNISFDFLNSILNGLMSDNLPITRSLQPIQKCQWYFFKSLKQGLLDAVNKLTGLKFYNNWFPIKNNKYLNQICIMIVNRMKKLSTIIQMQMDVHRTLTNCEFFYIHRFQYSYNQLKKIYCSEINEESQDVKCTFILAVFRNKVHFTCLIKQELSAAKYTSILKQAFQNTIRTKNEFAVVLYQFSIKRSTMQWAVLSSLYSFFLKRFDSVLYVVNSPIYFKIHFAVNLHIEKWLQQNALKLNQKIFFALLKQKIEQTAKNFNKLKLVNYQA